MGDDKTEGVRPPDVLATDDDIIEGALLDVALHMPRNIVRRWVAVPVPLDEFPRSDEPSLQESSISPKTFPYSFTLSGMEFVEHLPVRVDDEGDEVVSLPDGLQADRRIMLRALMMGIRTGELLQRMRVCLGLKGVELAQLLRVSRVTLSRWENGKRAIDERTFILVAALVQDAIDGNDLTRRLLTRLAADPYVLREGGAICEVLHDESLALARFVRLGTLHPERDYRLEQGGRMLYERPASQDEAGHAVTTTP